MTNLLLLYVPQTKQKVSQKPPLIFHKPDAYFSSSFYRLFIPDSDGSLARTTRRQKTAKEEERLLEKRIKEIVEMRSLEASQKDIRKIYSVGL